MGFILEAVAIYSGQFFSPPRAFALSVFFIISSIFVEAHALLESKTHIELARIFEVNVMKEHSEPSLQCQNKTADQTDDFISDFDFEEYLSHYQLRSNPSFAEFPSGNGLCGMNKKEYFSLQFYTGGLHARSINAALRNKDATGLARYNMIIQHAESALRKLKPYEGYTIRGAKIPREALEDHVKGAKIRYESFTSTSLSSTVARSFGNETRYVILSKSCRYINPLSRLQKEKEILCLPGTIFHILYRNDNGQGGTDILMEETDPEPD